MSHLLVEGAIFQPMRVVSAAWSNEDVATHSTSPPAEAISLCEYETIIVSSITVDFHAA